MNRRLHYFDMLKGLAIFMVVMGHVITMCIRDIDQTVVFKFIREIHMPLFFFISGWFTCKITGGGGFKLPNYGARARQLLLPMVVVSSLWVLYFPHSGLQSPLDSTFSGLWSNVWKNGYWFTLVLFEIMCIYALFTAILRLCRNLLAQIAVTIAVSAVLILVGNILPAEINDYLSFALVATFFPAFAAGVLARIHSQRFLDMCSRQTAPTVAMLAGALLLYYMCWYWEFPSLPEWCLTIATPLFHICLAIVAIAVVKPWSEAAFADDATPHRLARMWRYIGTQSLSIYLLHYFFLFPLTPLREPLLQMGLGFTPAFTIATIVAAMVVAITLGVNYVISRSSLISLLLTGNSPRKTKQ